MQNTVARRCNGGEPPPGHRHRLGHSRLRVAWITVTSCRLIQASAPHGSPRIQPDANQLCCRRIASSRAGRDPTIASVKPHSCGADQTPPPSTECHRPDIVSAMLRTCRMWSHATLATFQIQCKPRTLRCGERAGSKATKERHMTDGRGRNKRA